MINCLKKQLKFDIFNYIERNSLFDRYFINCYNNSPMNYNYSDLRKISGSSFDNKSRYKFSFGNEQNNKNRLSEENNNLECFEKVDLSSNDVQESSNFVSK